MGAQTVRWTKPQQADKVPFVDGVCEDNVAWLTESHNGPIHQIHSCHLSTAKPCFQCRTGDSAYSVSRTHTISVCNCQAAGKSHCTQKEPGWRQDRRQQKQRPAYWVGLAARGHVWIKDPWPGGPSQYRIQCGPGRLNSRHKCPCRQAWPQLACGFCLHEYSWLSCVLRSHMCGHHTTRCCTASGFLSSDTSAAGKNQLKRKNEP